MTRFNESVIVKKVNFITFPNLIAVFRSNEVLPPFQVKGLAAEVERLSSLCENLEKKNAILVSTWTLIASIFVHHGRLYYILRDPK